MMTNGLTAEHQRYHFNGLLLVSQTKKSRVTPNGLMSVSFCSTSICSSVMQYGRNYYIINSWVLRGLNCQGAVLGINEDVTSHWYFEQLIATPALHFLAFIYKLTRVYEGIYKGFSFNKKKKKTKFCSLKVY